MKTNLNITKPDKIICEACGEDFTCDANAEKCWCFEIDLSEETLAELHENFKRCLCLKCVQSYKFSHESIGGSPTLT